MPYCQVKSVTRKAGGRITLFGQPRSTPSPPHTCGGEGRGEEVPCSMGGSWKGASTRRTPLPVPLPALPRGEWTSSDALRGMCKKMRCAQEQRNLPFPEVRCALSQVRG